VEHLLQIDFFRYEGRPDRRRGDPEDVAQLVLYPALLRGDRRVERLLALLELVPDVLVAVVAAQTTADTAKRARRLRAHLALLHRRHDPRHG
jgi:hypothetical protein